MEPVCPIPNQSAISSVRVSVNCWGAVENLYYPAHPSRMRDDGESLEFAEPYVADLTAVHALSLSCRNGFLDRGDRRNLHVLPDQPAKLFGYRDVIGDNIALFSRIAL